MTLKSYILYIFLAIGLLITPGCGNELDDARDNFLANCEVATQYLDSIMYGSTTSTQSDLKNGLPFERFKIVHISDMHVSSWTADDNYKEPQNVSEAVTFANIPEMRINALIATGDFISNNEKTTHSVAYDYMNGFFNSFYSSDNAIPSFVCTGNHDSNMLTDNTDYYLSKSDMHSLLFSKTNYDLTQPADENYYYTDLTDSNGETFRIIALDNADQEAFDYNSMHYVCFTQTQVDWLINTALTENMTDNHHVIILNHHPFQPYSKTAETYMASGTHLYSEKMIPDIINAYIQKGSVQRNYKTCIAPKQTITVNADFSAAKGEFVCYLGGHVHTSASFEVPCNDSSTKQIMLLANTLSPDLQNNNYSYTYRKKSSQSSNSFSIYAIDTQEQKIYITYFGAKRSDAPTIESISYR